MIYVAEEFHIAGTIGDITYLTMKMLAGLLPAMHFRRIPRSYIVNTQHIRVIGREGVTMIGVTILPAGDAYKINIRDISDL